MVSAKRKRQAKGRSKNKPVTPRGSQIVNGNHNEGENTPPPKPVLDSPFSIDMFQRLNKHPYDDPTLPPRLNTIVHIRPEATWASLSKFNNFTIRDHKYAVHQYALVSRFQPLPKAHNPSDVDEEIICPARILEIRAFDAKNVYIRLLWLYTPNELPSGRMPYHGRDELIATNHMEIVDVARVIEPLTVLDMRQYEETKPGPSLGPYWRQTFHILTKELSPPQTHCICNLPICPDNTLIRCTNPKCALLLHGKCIEDATLAKLRRLQQSQHQDPLPIAPLLEPYYKSPPASSQRAATDYAAQIIVSQRSNSLGRRRVGCTDVAADRHWELDIECLGCGKRIL